MLSRTTTWSGPRPVTRTRCSRRRTTSWYASPAGRRPRSRRDDATVGDPAPVARLTARRAQSPGPDGGRPGPVAPDAGCPLRQDARDGQRTHVHDPRRRPAALGVAHGLGRRGTVAGRAQLGATRAGDLADRPAPARQPRPVERSRAVRRTGAGATSRPGRSDHPRATRTAQGADLLAGCAAGVGRVAPLPRAARRGGHRRSPGRVAGHLQPLGINSGAARLRPSGGGTYRRGATYVGRGLV